MGTSAKIIPLKKVIKTYRQAHPKQVRNVDGIKYFNNQQIKYLRRTVRDRAELDRSKNNTTGIKEWMVIDLLTSTGIRVDEASKIRCGDIRAGYAESALFIHQGKGSRSRTVQIPESLKKHLKQFLAWKRQIGESIAEDDCLFLGQRGPWTRQAIQQIVKNIKLLFMCLPQPLIRTITGFSTVRVLNQRFINKAEMQKNKL